MRIAEPIETIGLFWLPGNSDEQLPGNLTITESGEIRVRITGVFGDFTAAIKERMRGSIRKLDRVLGIVEKGGLVSLVNCRYQPSRVSLSGGLSNSEIIAETALFGISLKDREPRITEFEFSVEGLDEWLAMSGIKVEVDDPRKGGSIHFRHLDPITHELADCTELRFDFRSDFTAPISISPLTEARVAQKASISLISKEPTDIEYFSTMAYRLCQFMAFALDEPVSIESITVSLEQDPREERIRRALPIRMYRQFPTWSEQKPNVSPHNILFTYWDVKEQFEDSLNRWLQGYKNETLGTALNHFFLSTSNLFQYLNTKFLQLALAIEVLHRKTCKEQTLVAKEEFDEILESVIDRLPDNCPEFVIRGIKTANHLSLQDRMQQMTDEFPWMFGDQQERQAFAKKVTSTRNYYAHLSSGAGRKAAKDQELVEVFDKLAGLFKLHLLQFVGFENDQIEAIVQRPNRLNSILSISQRRTK